jgi:DNA adenine methylase
MASEAQDNGAPLKGANVSSVPQRSPFRYPGGKTWLVPQVRAWLGSRPEPPHLLVEPFAGGGSVSLAAVAEGLAQAALLVELDPQVSAVWRVACGGGAEALAERITSFQMGPEEVAHVLESPAHSDLDRAFQAILRNRVNRGGVMAPGAGLLKEGERGRGLHSRWYPETLARRLRAIGEMEGRLDAREGDGLEAVASHAQDEGCAFFIDPPYTAPSGKRAGRRLYAHSDVDHERVFSLAASVRGDVLLTYDDNPRVRGLAEAHGFQVRTVAMRNTHHAHLEELLIGRDLSWAA